MSGTLSEAFLLADPMTLLMAIVLMLLAASGVWWSMAAGTTVAPRASMCLAVANALLAGGLGVDALGGQAPGLLRDGGGDLLAIGAFAVLRAGVPAIVGEPLAWRSALAVWLASAVLLVAVPLEGDMRWHVRAVHTALGALVAMSCVDAWRQLRRHVRPALSALLITPLFAVFVLLAARLLESFWQPAQTVDVRQLNEFNVIWLWMTLLVSLVLNATMACLIVMRLVLSIHRLTRRDPLTDVYNRRALSEAIAAEHLQLQRGRPYALVMIDMDRFKQLNDTLGHAAGDAALCRLVEALKPCVRDVDRLGRLGGEEFCTLLPLTDLVGALLVAERMRANLEESAFEWQGHPWQLTASFGIAEARPEDASADAVLGRADRAMYKAKAQGRNVVQADD
ncbi:GGDEF domain-containing protein [Paucibacter sp. R3-3]|uniref:diguanylate cyclase n=1 Tax=Roseateles agri TaxID=3098619 RepID=A0ABU5DRD2_9BURK|nr:GGDEF domain-containing protein [Paucibacter sp. R3-3]MDY0748886.1 GGDEF domain-containing protein [Paucibacter sp. R3-3]